MRRASVLLAAALTGCAVGPDYQQPDFNIPAAYQRPVSTTGTAAAWWEGFDDPALSTLVEEALEGNLTIAAADARLNQAQAFVGASRSDFFPRVDGLVTSTLSEGGQSRSTGDAVGFWTIDLFGSLRRQLEVARANAKAAEDNLADAERLTAAALTSSYVELRRTDARIVLLDQSLDLQRQTLRIVQLRAEAGLAADLDVQRAAGDLARTRAQQGPLNAARAGAAFSINVLKGNAPGTEKIERTDDAAVPHYEGGPSAGVPANLLRTRPDVRSAEAQLMAATALIGAELSDLFPQLNLTGVVSTNLEASDLAGSAAARASAILDVPLLDAGRRLAEVRAARANADAALAVYEQTLLFALEETENALVDIEAAEARQRDLAVAVKASETAFDQLQALYKEGLATLIDVLDAQRQLISSRESFVDSEAALAQAYVRLYAALGETGTTDNEA